MSLDAALADIAAGADRAVAHLAAVVAIDTSYPPGQNYVDVVAWAEARLAPLGYACRRVEVPRRLWDVPGAGAAGPRVNLVAELANGRAPVGIYAHTDVVPAGAGWTVPPFAATRRTEAGVDWVLGRGAADMKASIAALIFALEALHRHGAGLRYAPRVLLCTDEEGGAYPGIRWLAEHGEVPAHLLCLDGGTAPRLWSGAFGSLELLLEVAGAAGHSGQHGSGDNALERAVPIMAALLALKAEVEGRDSALPGRDGRPLRPDPGGHGVRGRHQGQHRAGPMRGAAEPPLCPRGGGRGRAGGDRGGNCGGGACGHALGAARHGAPRRGAGRASGAALGGLASGDGGRLWLDGAAGGLWRDLVLRHGLGAAGPHGGGGAGDPAGRRHRPRLPRACGR